MDVRPTVHGLEITTGNYERMKGRAGAFFLLKRRMHAAYIKGLAGTVTSVKSDRDEYAALL